MFKRIVVCLLIVCAGTSQFVKADEGMWMLSLLKKLNEADMQKLGCKLTADQIYDINNSSLKDAFVSLGGFCTGQMISKDGLLITNHHCGLEAVQDHSSSEHDYLTNGFWAKTRDEELSNPGLFVKFLVRMEDVTDQVKKELSDTLSDAQFQDALPKIYAKIKKAATDSTSYTADVKSMFKGDEFYLFVYETFKDVRLVGAPPIKIGNFGGDTDNWMWPRHTGDFSMFRVYCSKDGKPAEYSKDNVPYTPKNFLSISLNGVKKDDYAMILGYPGATDRYLTSAGVEMAVEVNNPAYVKIRDKKLEIIEHDMKADDAVRIKYQAKHNETSNYWKFFIGQTKQLKRMHVADKKREEEKKFNEWANADATRKTKYGTITNDLKNAYSDMRKVVLTRTYLNEAIFQGAEILPFAYRFQSLEKILENKE
ncbi:MAG: S46 family peptidase, partial [Bacteroidota bacterium]